MLPIRFGSSSSFIFCNSCTTTATQSAARSASSCESDLFVLATYEHGQLCGLARDMVDASNLSKIAALQEHVDYSLERGSNNGHDLCDWLEHA